MEAKLPVHRIPQRAAGWRTHSAGWPTARWKAVSVGCRVFALALILGCGAIDDYCRDRLLDASDVIDVSYGTGLGIGAHVQASTWLGAGIGISSVTYNREWFGRRSIVIHDGMFFHVVVIGGKGLFTHGDSARGAVEVLGINLLGFPEPTGSGADKWFEFGDGPPLIDRFRFGAEIYLPGGHCGIFLNVGELVDLLGGLASYDMASDDGQPKDNVGTDDC